MDASQHNFSFKSITDAISEENAQPAKNRLVKEMESNANQLKHMKATADNFKLLLAEKEKLVDDLKLGTHLIKQSVRPVDDKIQVIRSQMREKRAGELDMLKKKIVVAEEWEKNFVGYISDFKFKIDGKNSRLLVHRRMMADECAALERRYHSEVENTKASLKELSKVHKQALADHIKLSDEKKFQLEKLQVLKHEFNQMRDQLEKIAVERTALSKQSKALDARVLQLDEMAKLERESATLLKIEDNKRNLAMRLKQISNAKTVKAQKIQTLTALNGKLKTMTKERDVLAEERKDLENSFAEQMRELENIAAELVSNQSQLENTKKRTEQFQAEMNKSLEEVRRKSECFSAELMREMEGVRRESVHFANQQDAKKRAEQQKLERTKEQMREELQSLAETMDVLRKGHQLEMDGKRRHYERQELDLQVFAEGEKEGNEFAISLIKSNIEKLGVKRQTAVTEFERQQAQIKQEVEWLRSKMDSVKRAADASKVIADNAQRAEVTRKLVRTLEHDINTKKAAYVHMYKNAYELKNDMARKDIPSQFDPQTMMIGHSAEIHDNPDKQFALGQGQGNFDFRMPALDGPVTKWQVQRGNGQVVEQVSVAGANGHFTTQTLSKAATQSDPANYHVETHQMQMTVPGFDSNSDCTTKFRKVVYKGKGIDMNVMNEAKRILAVHQNGVTQEVEETDEDFKLRKVLVKRAADLLQMMENAEFAQNSTVLKPKEPKVAENMARAQAVFSQITQLVAHNQPAVVCDLNQTMTQLETQLHRDGQKISNMKNAYVRNHGMGKK